MDVDGTLTDGKIYMGSNGEIMKAFDVKDGYAIAHILPKYKIVPVIITGRSSKILEKRAKELNIVELHQGVADKLAKLKEIAQKYEIQVRETAYIGDDLNDLECIRYCELTACPCDAVELVRHKVNYICNSAGGNGAVREFIELILSNEHFII